MKELCISSGNEVLVQYAASVDDSGTSSTQYKWGTVIPSTTINSSGISTNAVTISKSSFAPLTIERSGSTSWAGIGFKNSNGILGYIYMTGSANSELKRATADQSDYYTILDTSNYSSYCATASHSHRMIYNSNGYGLGALSSGAGVIPMQNSGSAANGVVKLGSSSYRFSEVWSTQALNTSSDRNLKTDFAEFDSRIEKAYMDFEPQTFRYRNFTEADHHDRIHYGFIAQDVESVLTKHGIGLEEVGFLCKDILDKPNVAGQLVEYSMRYGEMTPLNTHMTQKAHRRIDVCVSRIASIEASSHSQQAQIKSLQYQLQQAFVLIAKQNKTIKQLQAAL
jgi:hypothetical protein